MAACTAGKRTTSGFIRRERSRAAVPRLFDHRQTTMKVAPVPPMLRLRTSMKPPWFSMMRWLIGEAQTGAALLGGKNG